MCDHPNLGQLVLAQGSEKKQWPSLQKLSALYQLIYTKSKGVLIR